METGIQIDMENISGLIHFIRGEKAILDSDLARLYEVPTKAFVGKGIFKKMRDQQFNIGLHINL